MSLLSHEFFAQDELSPKLKAQEKFDDFLSQNPAAIQCGTLTELEKNKFKGFFSDLDFKILDLWITKFNHIENLKINFVFPENHKRAGKPLDNICIIGHNGSAKTTVLQILNSSLTQGSCHDVLQDWQEQILIRVGIQFHNGEILYIHTVKLFDKHTNRQVGDFAFHSQRTLEEFYENPSLFTTSHPLYSVLHQENQSNNLTARMQKNGAKIAFCTEESNQGSISAINRNYSLNELNSFNKNDSKLQFQRINNDNLLAFWANFVKEMQERKIEFEKFSSENEERILKEIKAEFDLKYPDFSFRLSKYWNSILKNVGLLVDTNSFKIPQTLDSQVETLIKFKDKSIRLNRLSSGIRSYIFRVGHIFSLFNQEKYSGTKILFMDEPELGLSPRFQDGLVNNYVSAATGAQVFMSTHSPIVASQFSSYEKFILDFDIDEKKVVLKKGTIEEGAFPEKLLYQEFGLDESLKGAAKDNYDLYVAMATKLKSLDGGEKLKMMEELHILKEKFGF